MRLNQFEELFRFLEGRHLPHQPLRDILVFRFIGGNLFFLKFHTGRLPFQKIILPVGRPERVPQAGWSFSTSRAFRPGPGH